MRQSTGMTGLGSQGRLRVLELYSSNRKFWHCAIYMWNILENQVPTSIPWHCCPTPLREVAISAQGLVC